MENKIIRIKIKQVPHCVDIAMCVLMIISLGVSFTLKTQTHTSVPEIIAALVIFGAFFIGIICCSVVKTMLTFGEGSIIKCQWLFLFWKLDIQDFYAVTYKLGSCRTRGGGTCYIFHLLFYRGNTASYKTKDLRERLAPPIAEQCIRRCFDNVQLMKLYRYIEENYPEKAKGYE